MSRKIFAVILILALCAGSAAAMSVSPHRTMNAALGDISNGEDNTIGGDSNGSNSINNNTDNNIDSNTDNNNNIDSNTDNSNNINNNTDNNNAITNEDPNNSNAITNIDGDNNSNAITNIDENNNSNAITNIDGNNSNTDQNSSPNTNNLTPENSGGTTVPETPGGTVIPENPGGTVIPENPGGTVVPENNPTQESAPLPEGSIIPITESDLAEGVIDKIAEAASADITEEDIKFITSADISPAEEPTEAMKQRAADEKLEFAAKLQTVRLNSAGYYLFEVDFPEELVGTKVEDIRLYFASQAARGSITSSQFMLVDQFLAGNELYNMMGDFAKTVPGKALVLLMANTGGSFTMYALKILLMLLAGGCETGSASYTWMWLAGLTVFALLALRRFRRH